MLNSSSNASSSAARLRLVSSIEATLRQRNQPDKLRPLPQVDQVVQRQQGAAVVRGRRQLAWGHKVAQALPVKRDIT